MEVSSKVDVYVRAIVRVCARLSVTQLNPSLSTDRSPKARLFLQCTLSTHSKQDYMKQNVFYVAILNISQVHLYYAV